MRDQRFGILAELIDIGKNGVYTLGPRQYYRGRRFGSNFCVPWGGEVGSAGTGDVVSVQ